MINGTFAPGNRLWEVRSSAGPKPRFTDPDQLWACAVEYFVWNDNNPLSEAKAFPTKDEIRVELLPKMRAMTVVGLCLFLDIHRDTWHGWKTKTSPIYRPDLIDIIAKIEDVIYAQKIAGAHAGLLNANLVARELGLADRNEVTGKDGGAIEHKVRARVVMVPPKTAAVVETNPMPVEGEA